MAAETIIDASGVSPEILLWLAKDQKGYFIVRLPNRADSVLDIFRVSDLVAEKIPSDPEKAWFAMERIVGAAPL